MKWRYAASPVLYWSQGEICISAHYDPINRLKHCLLLSCEYILSANWLENFPYLLWPLGGGGGEGGEGKHSVVDETVNFTAHDE